LPTNNENQSEKRRELGRRNRRTPPGPPNESGIARRTKKS